MEEQRMTFEDTALRFAQALAALDFHRAHAELCPALQAELTPAALRERSMAMLATADGGTVDTVDVGETLEDWPTKETGDVGWAYVALSGKTFAEAVTVVVKTEGGRFCIREVTWGRP